MVTDLKYLRLNVFALYNGAVRSQANERRFMRKDILLILIDKRQQQAEKVQKILTGWGCLVKTRLGLHTGVLDECTDSGLIFVELVGDQDKHAELVRKLDMLSGVSAKLVELELNS